MVLGLGLMYAQDFFPLRPTAAVLCAFLGVAIYFSQFVSTASLSKEPPPAQASLHQAASAISSLVSIGLFVTAYLVLPLWLHGLLEMGAGAALFFCFSLPRSRWTEASMVPIFLFAILQTNWRGLGVIANFPPILLIAIVIASVALSHIAFRIIDRRNAAHNDVELN
ncbi:MAG: hypothetical protein V4555_10950 [Acidobacteriota bacterium]